MGPTQWREKLLKERGVDYAKTPAEDFATGMVTYRNPETGQSVKAQFTDSWMFEKQGLRLFMDGMGPGYAFEINTLVSPLNVFIGDAAARPSPIRRGLWRRPRRARPARGAVQRSRPVRLHGREWRHAEGVLCGARRYVVLGTTAWKSQRLVMASYLSAERGKTIDLTDKAVLAELDDYVPAIQQGKGRDQLLKP